MPARRNSAARRSPSLRPASSAETKKTSGRGLGHRTSGRLQQEGEPLLSHAEADARGGRTAERLHQAVVAATAGHGRLGSERVARELVGGAHVVVEAADEPWIHLVGDPQIVEPLANGVEVRPAPVAEPLEEARRLGQDRLAGGHLAVEHPQRVALGALPAVGAERARTLAQPAPQLLEVGRTAGGVADAVDVQPPARRRAAGTGRRASRSARRRWPARRCRRPRTPIWWNCR